MKGKKQEAVEIEYNPQEETEGLRRDDVDMHDKRQRERYVRTCLEQMAEASKELETLLTLSVFYNPALMPESAPLSADDTVSCLFPP